MAQKRSIPYRLGRRHLVRFEVLGCAADRELVRAVAQRLARGGPDALWLRTLLRVRKAQSKGAIIAALRRSPLVGAGLTLTRPHESGRTLQQLRAFRGRLPADFKFDRDEANRR